MPHPRATPGAVLAGKYRVERELGSGGMGVVVAATHFGLGETVALKLMLPGREDRAELEKRLLREARAAARLRSRHVARVLDAGTLDDGSPFLVMEHIEGRSLAATIASGGPLPVADAVEHVLQACEAIAEAHAAGIVHRDLKPANLFVTAGGGGTTCVKVLDFGVSKVHDAGTTLTDTSETLGSPLYMSPEQMNSARDVDGRADVWSLGAILHELVSGEPPFTAETIQEACVRVLFHPPAPLASRADLPPGLEAVILRCLEKDRDRRFPTVADLAAALAPFAPPRASHYPPRIAGLLGVPAPAPVSAPAPSPVSAPVPVSAPAPAPVPVSTPAPVSAPASVPVPVPVPAGLSRRATVALVLGGAALLVLTSVIAFAAGRHFAAASTSDRGVTDGQRR